MKESRYPDYVPIARTVGKRLVLALLLHCVCYCLYDFVVMWFGWPISITNLARLEDITDIHFPKSTQIVKATDHWYGPSEIVYAQVQIPITDLPGFLHQKGIRLDPTVGACIDDPVQRQEWLTGCRADMAKNGCGYAIDSTLQTATFSNGSFTDLWINRNDKWATISIHYDEP